MSRQPDLRGRMAELEARASTQTKDLIDRDLHRVGRQGLNVSDAAAVTHRDALRSVLLAWCVEHPDDYHQAMSHVAAALLVAGSDAPTATSSDECAPTAAPYDVDLTYHRFRLLVASLPACFYDDALRGCRVEVRALWLLASDPQFRTREHEATLLAPGLREAFELVATQWLLTIMASVLPLACTHRLWQRMTAGSSGWGGLGAIKCTPTVVFAPV